MEKVRSLNRTNKGIGGTVCVTEVSKALIRQLKQELTGQPLPGERLIDTKLVIGSAAGRLYNILKENGKVAIPTIIQKTGLKEYYVHQAIGWLACQEKVRLSKDAKTAYVALQSGA